MAGGRKSSLTAEIDDYSTIGEIGVKMNFHCRDLGEPFVDVCKTL